MGREVQEHIGDIDWNQIRKDCCRELGFVISQMGSYSRVLNREGMQTNSI